MGIAQVVEVDGAGVVGGLHLGGEDRVKTPLLQDQLRNRKIHRLGVVVDDVAVLVRLGVHQVLDELPGNRIHRQVAKTADISVGLEDVVHHLANQ